MADVVSNWTPTRHADTTLRGVHLTFADNDIASFAKPINRSLDGAAYDPGTRAGLPLVGQGGGVYVADDAASYWQGAAYAAGVSIGGEHEVTALPAAARIIAQNGADHLARVDAAGQFEVSLNSGATYSTAAWNALGRGPFHWVATHDGTNQHLWINGREADSDVAALDVPAGNLQVGRSGETRRLWCLPSQPDARPLYLTEFASRILWQWQPRDVGEGPAGGILTGSASGVGGYTCPLGAATMGFVYRNGVGLCLTDSSAAAMSRIDFEHESRPAFGSWLSTHYIRAAATDNPRFGLTDVRGRDFTGAAAPGYWWQVQQAAGVMQLTVHEANGAAVLTVNHTAAGAADDRVDCLVTRAVKGDFRAYLAVNGVWVGNSATVWNDVTTLATGVVSIAPRGGHVARVTRWQGEALPAELGL